jgi:hypothetical protein
MHRDAPVITDFDSLDPAMGDRLVTCKHQNCGGLMES